MVAKFLTFFGLVAAAAAVAIPVSPVGKVVYAEPQAPANYQFSYSVHDPQSGDVKEQQESRSGDAVHGSYSLVQPDGVHRIVEYTADEHNGFNAIVRYEGTPVHHAPAKVAVAASPVYAHAASPVYSHAAAPVYAHAAPVAKVAYAPAPITKVAYAPAPITKVAYSHAPVAVAAPVAKVAYAQPAISYAAPQVTYAHAPVAKLAYAHAPVAKVAYTQNLGQVTFSSPAVTYHH